MSTARTGLRSIAALVLITATTVACGSSAASSGPAPASATPASTAPSPASVESAPTRRYANTGIYPYDFGYNEAVAADMRTTNDCESLARSSWNQMPEGLERESDFLAVYQGCVDGIFDRIPHATFPSDLPAGGVPYVDPCQKGDIEPWVIIYDGPSGAGDIGVGAPCQELAERFALEHLPPGSFVIESWRA